MIHYILRFYSMIGLWVNFRKIYIERRDRVPTEPTIIYGLNHPTAFIEPILLGTHVKESCWYMLRGDMFNSKLASKFLHSIHNLPIYRKIDGGASAIRRNMKSMDYATDMLLKNEPTIILSEGSARHERRLRPIQRGTARMLFQAYKKDMSKPVCIVPTAANYTAANDFRSSVALTFGEPIFAEDYYEDFKQDKRATIENVTQELQKRLSELVIHVEDRKREPLVDKLFPIIQNGNPDMGVWPVKEGNSPFTKKQYNAVQKINAFSDQEASNLEFDIDNYLRALASKGVSDNGIANPDYGSLGRALKLWILSPIATIGFLFYYPLAAFVQARTKKTVKTAQFYSSVRYALGLGTNFIWVLIWVAITSILIGWFALVLIVVLPLLGYFFLQWFESFKLWRESARIRSLSEEDKTDFLAQRKSILNAVDLA